MSTAREFWDLGCVPNLVEVTIRLSERGRGTSRMRIESLCRFRPGKGNQTRHDNLAARVLAQEMPETPDLLCSSVRDQQGPPSLSQIWARARSVSSRRSTPITRRDAARDLRCWAAPGRSWAAIAGPATGSLMCVEEGYRQFRTLDVGVVPEAGERNRCRTKPGQLPIGVHRVVLTAGKGHRGLRSCQQLRHIGRPGREGTRVHGQPPSPVLLAQSGINGWVTGGQQAGQTGYPQVADGSLLTRGEPGAWPAGRGLSPIQVLIGPDSLDPQADHRLHRHGGPAAGQGQTDDAA